MQAEQDPRVKEAKLIFQTYQTALFQLKTDYESDACRESALELGTHYCELSRGLVIVDGMPSYDKAKVIKEVDDTREDGRKWARRPFKDRLANLTEVYKSGIINGEQYKAERFKILNES